MRDNLHEYHDRAVWDGGSIVSSQREHSFHLPGQLSYWEERIYSSFPLPSVRLKQFEGNEPVPSENTTEDMTEVLHVTTDSLSEEQAQVVNELMTAEFLLSSLLSSERKIRMDAVLLVDSLKEEMRVQLLQELEQMLSCEDEATRLAAVETFSQLARKEQIGALVTTLDDPLWRVREVALRGLVRLETEMTFDILLRVFQRALNDPDFSVRDAAIWLLKPVALRSLRVAGDKAPLELLLEALHDENEIVRTAAVEAIGDLKDELQDELPLEELIATLGDKHELVRAVAVETLGDLEEDAPVDRLVDALHDDHELVRAVTVKVLGSLGELVPIEPLILAIKDGKETVRSEASVVLGRLYEQVYERASTDFLLSLLHDDDEQVRTLAAWALGERSEYAAYGPLTRALKDPSALVRDTVAWALLQFTQRQMLVRNEVLAIKNDVQLSQEPLQLSSDEVAWTPAKDLLRSLVHFMKKKKGYVVAEERNGGVLVLKFYYQKEDQSVQDDVFTPRQRYTSVDHLEKALKENDKIIQDVARQALAKREKRKWTETFLVSLDLLANQEHFSQEDIPAKVIVCSTGYQQMRANELSICQSIDRYLYRHKDRPDYQHLCAWIEKCKEAVFEQGEGVRGMRIWYDTAASPANMPLPRFRTEKYYQMF